MHLIRSPYLRSFLPSAYPERTVAVFYPHRYRARKWVRSCNRSANLSFRSRSLMNLNVRCVTCISPMTHARLSRASYSRFIPSSRTSQVSASCDRHRLNLTKLTHKRYLPYGMINNQFLSCYQPSSRNGRAFRMLTARRGTMLNARVP